MVSALRQHIPATDSVGEATPSSTVGSDAQHQMRARIHADANTHSTPIPGVQVHPLTIRVSKLQGLAGRKPLWPQGMRMSERDLWRDADMQEIWRRFVSSQATVYWLSDRTQWYKGGLMALVVVCAFLLTQLHWPRWHDRAFENLGSVMVSVGSALGGAPKPVISNTPLHPAVAVAPNPAAAGAIWPQGSQAASAEDGKRDSAPAAPSASSSPMPTPFGDTFGKYWDRFSVSGKAASTPASAAPATAPTNAAPSPVALSGTAVSAPSPGLAAPASAGTSTTSSSVPTVGASAAVPDGQPIRPVAVEGYVGLDGVMLRLSNGQVRMYRVHGVIAPGESITRIDATQGIVTTTRRELKKVNPS